MTLILSLKKLVEEYKRQFRKKMLQNTYFFSVPIKKQVKRIYKIGKEVTETKSKCKVANQNLLTAQYLWQVHYQISSIILLMELNVM